MLNTFNINLNVDKSIREVTPPLVHRVGDPSGLTIIATIKQGKKLVSVAGSATLVCNFEDQTKLELACKASGNTITVTFNDSFKDHYGFASCYFVLLGGYTTSVFKVKCIPNVEYTDDDLIWENANFKGKVSGSLKENPNILARYRDTTYSASRPTKKISTDLFSNMAETYEAKQNYYDASSKGFYITTSGNEFSESNILTDDPIDGDQREDVVLANGKTSSQPKWYLYPTFARFKVPNNVRKVILNNILVNKNLITGQAGSFIAFSEPSYIVVWKDSINASYYKLDYYSTSSNDFPGIKDLPGVKVVKPANPDLWNRPEVVSFDCSKINIVDKYGYIDVMLNIYRSAQGNTALENREAYNAKINMDYGYLDLS